MLVILISTLRVSKCVSFVATTRVRFWTWIWPTRHYRLGQEVACSKKIQLAFFSWSNNLDTIDVKTGDSVFEKKLSFKILGLFFTSKLDWNPHITSVSKTASTKIRALICSICFFSLEVALYFYESTIEPCMSVLMLLTAT